MSPIRIEKKDLPTKDLQDLCDVIGINKTLEVIKKMSGSRITIPKTMGKCFNIRYIKDHYNGNNKNYICETLQISNTTFHRYLNESML